jgi:hypothetical protein
MTVSEKPDKKPANFFGSTSRGSFIALTFGDSADFTGILLMNYSTIYDE